MSVRDTEALQELLTEVMACAYDPLRYVMLAFPWGREGTPLERFEGPRGWQREVLEEMGDHLRAGRRDEAFRVYRKAVASGRGIGKSALVSWLVMWFMSVVLGGTCIVTANTETQLRSRTWAELRKWRALAINGDWFDVTATRLKPAGWFGQVLTDQLGIDVGYYYAEAQLWSEENPDAFAGVHNQNGMLLIFDEASGIAKPIWSVSEGFFTDPVLHRYWLVFSNPRRNSGAFKDCWRDDESNVGDGAWRCRNIDSRDVEGVDVEFLQGIVDRYGEDSDEARVEVRGLFPRVGSQQFLSVEEVDEGMGVALGVDEAPLIMGIDVARFGDDRTCFGWRSGRNGRVYPIDVFKGLDTMEVVREAAWRIDARKPRVVFIDEIGIGAGVVDRLKQLGYPVIGVNVSRKARRPEYGNRRIELYGALREWLKDGGGLPADSELREELVSLEFKYVGNKQYLESKDDAKKRGIRSPDKGDCFALTFSEPVAGEDVWSFRRRSRSSASTGFSWTV